MVPKRMTWKNVIYIGGYSNELSLFPSSVVCRIFLSNLTPLNEFSIKSFKFVWMKNFNKVETLEKGSENDDRNFKNKSLIETPGIKLKQIMSG